MTFQLQNFHLYDKPLEDWFLRKQFVLFLSNLNVSLSFPLGNIENLRNKITCFATDRDQSLSIYGPALKRNINEHQSNDMFRRGAVELF